MIGLLRAEVLKLRTITMNWVLAVIALLFPVAITVIAMAATGEDEFGAARSIVEVLSGTNRVAVMLLGVIAAVSITNEYGFGTIRPTFAATPRRSRVVLAKGVVAIVTAMLIDSVVLITALLGANAVAPERFDGTTFDVFAVDGLGEMLVGSVVLAGIAALAAYGVGMLVRSTPASVAVFLLWPLLIEGLIGGVIVAVTKNDDILQWLPFNAGFGLGDPGNGPDGTVGGLSRVGSGLYFGAVALGLAVLGAISVQRRDA